MIENTELKLLFSGDSGYLDDLAKIGRRYGPSDLTMPEIDAYSERQPYVHMHPQQTLQTHRGLDRHWPLPIHNDTFDLAMYAWYGPFERILELTTEHGVRVLAPMVDERIDPQALHAGRYWWREMVDSETQVQGHGCHRSQVGERLHEDSRRKPPWSRFGMRDAALGLVNLYIRIMYTTLN